MNLNVLTQVSRKGPEIKDGWDVSMRHKLFEQKFAESRTETDEVSLHEKQWFHGIL